jgi:hypothetical protein
MPLDPARVESEILRLEALQRKLYQKGPGNFSVEKTKITRKINQLWNSLTEEQRGVIMQRAVCTLDVR